MEIETYLAEIRTFFNDILISGVNYIPLSIIKKLKLYVEISESYNLFTLSNLITKFINDNKNRNNIFIDISIWLDIAILEYENISINK